MSSRRSPASFSCSGAVARPGRYDQGSVGEERDQACMNGALGAPDSRESSRPLSINKRIHQHTDLRHGGDVKES